METKKKHKVFIQGAISPSFIADSILKHSSKTNIGAHDIFLGQVRADERNGKPVQSIEYSAYEEMAEDVFYEIRETAFDKFDLTCMHIYHSLGTVEVGKLSLFVFVSAKHRAVTFEACKWIVDEIKSKAPVWGKEIFEDESHSWKINSTIS